MDQQLLHTPNSQLISQSAALANTAAPSTSSRQRSSRQSSQQLTASCGTTPIEAMEDKFGALTAVAGQLFQQRSSNLTQLDALKQETDQSTAVVEQMQKAHAQLTNTKAQCEAELEEMMQVTSNKQSQVAQAEKSVLRTAMVQERVTRDVLPITTRVADVIKRVASNNADVTNLVEGASALCGGEPLDRLSDQARSLGEVSQHIIALRDECMSLLHVHGVCATGFGNTPAAEEVDGERAQLLRRIALLPQASLNRLRASYTVMPTAWRSSPGLTSSEPRCIDILLDELVARVPGSRHRKERATIASLAHIRGAEDLVSTACENPSLVASSFADYLRMATAVQQTVSDAGLPSAVASILTEGMTLAQISTEECRMQQNLLDGFAETLKSRRGALEDRITSSLQVDEEIGRLSLYLAHLDASIVDIQQDPAEDDEASRIAALRQTLQNEEEQLVLMAANSSEDVKSVVALEEKTAADEAAVANLKLMTAVTEEATAAARGDLQSILGRLENDITDIEGERVAFEALCAFDADLRKTSFQIRNETLGNVSSAVSTLSVLLAPEGELHGRTDEDIRAEVLLRLCPELPVPPTTVGRWESNDADIPVSVAEFSNELPESHHYPPTTPLNPHGGGMAAEHFLQQQAYSITNESQFFESSVKLQMMNILHSLQQEITIHNTKATQERQACSQLIQTTVQTQHPSHIAFAEQLLRGH